MADGIESQTKPVPQPSGEPDPQPNGGPVPKPGSEPGPESNRLFAAVILALTSLLSGVSYAIVVLDGIYDWGLSPVAIAALIIEAPIQFVVVLYVIVKILGGPNRQTGTRTGDVEPD